MNNKDRKRQIAYEALMILGLLALLTFICRLYSLLPLQSATISRTLRGSTEIPSSILLT